METATETFNPQPVDRPAGAGGSIPQLVAEHIKERGARDMQEVIRRLRASRERVGSERHREGVECGKDWAMNHAEADELARLEALYDVHERDSWGWGGFFSAHSHRDAATRLALAILGGEDADRTDEDADEFWDRNAGAPPSRRQQEGDLFEDFVRGFVDGALDVWDEVKDEL